MVTSILQNVDGTLILLKLYSYQKLVVIQHRVQILDPLWIDIPVKDDPLPLVDLAPHVVNDATEHVGEQTVTPLARVRVQHAVQCFLRHSLGIDDMSNSFDSFVKLESFQEDAPSAGFAGTGWADHHQTWKTEDINLDYISAVRSTCFKAGKLIWKVFDLTLT